MRAIGVIFALACALALTPAFAQPSEAKPGNGNSNATAKEPASGSIPERVGKLLVEYLGVEPKKIVPSATLRGNLGADDLDMVELTMAFEEAFGCEIADATVDSMHSVADAIRVAENCANTPKAPPKATSPQQK